ncbi:MAG: 2,3-bisphosphoglycerate-independent phosphoglycerate mutase [Legionellaceae bacterium]|nr:2,3-bisphosphoglycerate-independent phosphoglycerate mutase [Legionellaceae bacterium]
MSNSPPFVFMVLDGWGYSEKFEYNAIAQAKTPQWDTWWRTQPHMLLDASGLPVGLPDDQMGNSEVGHMHLGAGRMIPQDFTRINHAIDDGSFASSLIFNNMFRQLAETNKTLHVFGLLSPGGVHSHENHLFAFLEQCSKQPTKLKHIALHLFLDGRDTPPQSAEASLERLKKQIKPYSNIHIHSICGRYYALDRDMRWDRVAPVYQLLTEGHAEACFNSAEEAIKHFYQQNIFDEFIPPTQISDAKPMQDGDAVFFFNFRSDRARELTHAFISDEFDGFQRNTRPKISHFISMTQYADDLNTTPVFPPSSIKQTLGEVLSQHHLRQLRVAETEKYAHVTFFFNGGSEMAFPNEERVLVPSPSDVATYDLKPEMSAPAITNIITQAIQNKTHDVIICNYANADMVGHTGNFNATIQAIEALDRAMHSIGEALKQVGGQLLITADHGNAESMFNHTTGQPHTAHTSGPVPLLYVGDPGLHFTHAEGSLIDIAPTVLDLLGICPPEAMTGQALMTRDAS